MPLAKSRGFSTTCHAFVPPFVFHLKLPTPTAELTERLNTMFTTLGFEHTIASEYNFIAGCVMLFYDFCLTFSQEVEYVWKQKLTLATTLFLVVRYFAPLEMVVYIFGFYHPFFFDPATCIKFLHFPSVANVFTITLIEILMSLRTYALYSRNTRLLIFLLFLIACQIIAMSLAVHDSRRIPFPEGVTGCAETGSHTYMVIFWLSPLVPDTIIFGLTLYKIRKIRNDMHRNMQRVSFLQGMLKDGIMYYMVICSVNLLTILIYISAPPDLQSITATIGYNLTTIMIERLVLNLQSHRTTSDSVDSSRSKDTTTDPAVFTSHIEFGYDDPTVESHPEPSSHQEPRRTKDGRSWFGNLSDRLADEQWGTAGVTEPEQSEGSRTDNTREPRDILEMENMTRSSRLKRT